MSRRETYWENGEYQCDNLPKYYILDHQMAPAFHQARARFVK